MLSIRTLSGTPKHLSKTGELNSFTYLMLNLPFVCNYKCTKCFNLERDVPHKDKSDKYLSLKERFGLIDQAQEMGGKVVVIAGEGEPSLDKNIKELVSYAYQKGLNSIVYSNGSLMTKDLVQFYKDHNTAIVFALDSIVPSKYDSLTCTKGLLPKVLQNIKNAIKVYGEPLFLQDLKVYNVAVNVTVSNANEGEVKKIKDLWQEKVYFICNPLAKLGNADTYWQTFGNDETSMKRQAKLIEELSETGGPLTLGSDGLCGYSRWGISVSPTGDYMTCAYTNLTNGLLGNARSLNLKEAFTKKQAIESTHYAQHGNSPCLVRAKSFSEYLKVLRR